MLRIKIDEKAIKLHKSYFEKNIKPKFAHPDDVVENTKKAIEKKKAPFIITTEIEEFICRMCYFFQKKWEDLAIGNVDKLRKIRSEWDCLFPMPRSYEPFIIEALIKLFSYNGFSRKTLETKDLEKVFSFDDYVKWSPYTFVYWLGVRVCPYCNRQYITPITTKTNRMRADLDHFWPKHKYPIFSMSLYNLVPSCKFCNSSLKHEEDPGRDAPHPYCDNYDDYFSFGTDNKESDHPEIKIDRCDNRIKDLLKMFCIEDQYKYHSNIARDFYIKSQLYQPGLIQTMLERNSSDYQTLLSIIVGYPIDQENISEEVLGKLKRDLAKELNFIY